ncbi:MAG: hypothetical protein NTX28_00525 [Novosphingobium sp.]|nr:hypothetical protein [Novosphingobium sp.]
MVPAPFIGQRHRQGMKPALPFLVASLTVLAGCAALPKAERSDGFARIGEVTLVGSAKVRPQAVIEDSRCPMNARCVWAGRAVVESRVTRGNTIETVRFTLGQADRGIVLDMVEPGTLTGTRISPSDYRFHFSVAQ